RLLLTARATASRPLADAMGGGAGFTKTVARGGVPDDSGHCGSAILDSNQWPPAPESGWVPQRGSPTLGKPALSLTSGEHSPAVGSTVWHGLTQKERMGSGWELQSASSPSGCRSRPQPSMAGQRPRSSPTCGSGERPSGFLRQQLNASVEPASPCSHSRRSGEQLHRRSRSTPKLC